VTVTVTVTGNVNGSRFGSYGDRNANARGFGFYGDRNANARGVGFSRHRAVTGQTPKGLTVIAIVIVTGTVQTDYR
jgi:hypothetical protein